MRTVANLIPWFGAMFALAMSAASASPDNALYQATTFVTGQYEPNRSVGFGKCLEYVLVKVTGDPRVVDDPRVATMAAYAKSYVVDFHYRDLMEGIPVHDEQGTRQRPYDLTVTFDPGKIAAAVHILGLEPWTGPRPRLVLIAGVRNGTAYMLANDGSRGRCRSYRPAGRPAREGDTEQSRIDVRHAARSRPRQPRCAGKGDGQRHCSHRHARLERQGPRLGRRLAARMEGRDPPLAGPGRQLRRCLPKRHRRSGTNPLRPWHAD